MSTTYQRLGILDTIKTSWALVYGAKATFAYAAGIALLFSLGLSLASYLIKMVLPSSEHALAVLSQILMLPMQVGFYYIALERAFDRPIYPMQVFHCYQPKLLLTIIGAYILQFVLLFTPTALLIGASALLSNQASPLISTVFFALSVLFVLFTLIVGVRISLLFYFILDKNVNPWQAVKQSFFATRGNVWPIIGLYLVLFVCVIISVIPIGIGLLWTIPLYAISFAVAYKTLRANLSP